MKVTIEFDASLFPRKELEPLYEELFDIERDCMVKEVEWPFPELPRKGETIKFLSEFLPVNSEYYDFFNYNVIQEAYWNFEKKEYCIEVGRGEIRERNITKTIMTIKDYIFTEPIEFCLGWKNLSVPHVSETLNYLGQLGRNNWERLFKAWYKSLVEGQKYITSVTSVGILEILKQYLTLRNEKFDPDDVDKFMSIMKEEDNLRSKLRVEYERIITTERRKVVSVYHEPSQYVDGEYFIFKNKIEVVIK